MQYYGSSRLSIWAVVDVSVAGSTLSSQRVNNLLPTKGSQAIEGPITGNGQPTLALGMSAVRPECI